MQDAGTVVLLLLGMLYLISLARVQSQSESEEQSKSVGGNQLATTLQGYIIS